MHCCWAMGMEQTDRQTNKQMDGLQHCLMPPTIGGVHNNRQKMYNCNIKTHRQDRHTAMYLLVMADSLLSNRDIASVRVRLDASIYISSTTSNLTTITKPSWYSKKYNEKVIQFATAAANHNTLSLEEIKSINMWDSDLTY